MQPVGGAGPLLSKVIATVREQPQAHTVILGAHQAKPGMVYRDRGDRGGV
jgi:hypothetical protein